MPAFYVVLQEKIAGVDAIGMEGRALSEHNDKLELLARQAGVRPLTSFFSVKKEEVLGILGSQEVEEGGLQIPEEQWFSPEEGLEMIAALLTGLSDASPENTVVMRELKEFQRVLEAARARNVPWHLGIDY
jgi:hypothetical protein